VTLDRDQYEKLVASVDEHLEKLRTERERFREVVEDIDMDEDPDDWRDQEAVANRLHNLYMGAEHIFRRIAKVVDGGLPDGERWHKDLLDQMKAATKDRIPVVDEELHAELLEFLQFRHFYREGYLVDVEWDEMTGLVGDYEAALNATLEAVEEFMDALEP